MIFLEDTKYSDAEEYVVKGGLFDGRFIYSHNGEPDLITAEDLAPVLQAASDRIAEVPLTHLHESELPPEPT